MQGKTVAILESRSGAQLAELVRRRGGTPLLAPALAEVPDMDSGFIAEFVAACACTAFTFVFSVFVNAPLLQYANINRTPNPSKAPWYFLGLQELLTMFHPMVAGVTIPGVGLIVLVLTPFIDSNPSTKPEDRKFAIALFTIFVMFWAVLVIIGSFFRGPGFNFTLPWRDGLFFEL